MLFSVVPRKKIRGNKHEFFKKTIFTTSVVKQWHRLTRQVVERPPSEISKTQSDNFLTKLV